MNKLIKFFKKELHLNCPQVRLSHTQPHTQREHFEKYWNWIYSSIKRYLFSQNWRNKTSFLPSKVLPLKVPPKFKKLSFTTDMLLQITRNQLLIDVFPRSTWHQQWLCGISEEKDKSNKNNQISGFMEEKKY